MGPLQAACSSLYCKNRTILQTPHTDVRLQFRGETSSGSAVQGYWSHDPDNNDEYNDQWPGKKRSRVLHVLCYQSPVTWLRTALNPSWFIEQQAPVKKVPSQKKSVIDGHPYCRWWGKESPRNKLGGCTEEQNRREGSIYTLPLGCSAGSSLAG